MGPRPVSVQHRNSGGGRIAEIRSAGSSSLTGLSIVSFIGPPAQPIDEDINQAQHPRLLCAIDVRWTNSSSAQPGPHEIRWPARVARAGRTGTRIVPWHIQMKSASVDRHRSSNRHRRPGIVSPFTSDPSAPYAQWVSRRKHRGERVRSARPQSSEPSASRRGRMRKRLCC